MNPVPASVKAPRFPQVNLVPPELALRKARGRQRAVALVLVGLFTLVLGAAGYFLHTVKIAAEDDLAEATAEFDRLQTELAKYSDVPRVKELLANSEAARSYAGATEIDMASFINSFVLQLPRDSVFDNIEFERASVDGNAPPGTTPFSRPDIGKITFSGWTPNVPNVALIARQLDALPGIESVRVTAAERALEEVAVEQSGDEGTVVYTFEVQARITVEALTRRFAPEDVEGATEPADDANSEGEDA